MLTGRLDIQLERRLGQGSFGDVFLAHSRGDDGFEKVVAVKRLRPEITRQPDIIEAFVVEARICGYLNHPNIIQVYGFTRCDGGHILIMEYLDGFPLNRVLNAWRSSGLGLPFTVGLEIVRQLCEGLYYAHTARRPDGEPMRLVHRDIKPGNVMLTTAGQIKIMDFGIAKSTMLVTETEAERIKGTVAYMAPQQALGRGGLDGTVDQFAAGLILAEIILGRRVYDRSELFEMLKAARDGDVGAAIEACATRLPGSERILLKALALKPADRFEDARRMAAAIAELQSRQPRSPLDITGIVHGLKDGLFPGEMGGRAIDGASAAFAVPGAEVSLGSHESLAGAQSQSLDSEELPTLRVNIAPAVAPALQPRGPELEGAREGAAIARALEAGARWSGAGADRGGLAARPLGGSGPGEATRPVGEAAAVQRSDAASGGGRSRPRSRWLVAAALGAVAAAAGIIAALWQMAAAPAVAPVPTRIALTQRDAAAPTPRPTLEPEAPSPPPIAPRQEPARALVVPQETGLGEAPAPQGEEAPASGQPQGQADVPLDLPADPAAGGGQPTPARSGDTVGPRPATVALRILSADGAKVTWEYEGARFALARAPQVPVNQDVVVIVQHAGVGTLEVCVHVAERDQICSFDGTTRAFKEAGCRCAS